MTIPLAVLDANCDRIRIRHGNFVMGFLLAATGIGMALVLTLAIGRKVEFLRFKNATGVVVLDIARSGKYADQFDSFVRALTHQIEACKAGGSASAP